MTRVADSGAFAAALLAWFDREQRRLPWRGVGDPYLVLLSEIMLQQTTVATVLGRWDGFVARFPTIEALAAAPTDDVLAAWRGLGYYRRARNLHAAARAVIDQHHGALPRTAEALRALPGIGAYTAAAVASIAFRDPVALVDANVRRVLARVLALEVSADSGVGERILLAAAQERLDRDNPGDFNQALMELGATLCTPVAPRCDHCPIARFCVAGTRGEAAAYPRLQPRPTFESVTEVAVAVHDASSVLVLKRRPDASFGGFWELPRGPISPGEELVSGARRIARELAGLTVLECGELLNLRHTVMQTRISLRVVTARVDGIAQPKGTLTPLHTEARWLAPADWASLPASTTQHKIALRLEGYLRS